MAYTKTNWKDGDVISAERMNKIEKGIEDAGVSGGSGEFIVTFTYTPYSHSWKCDSNNTDIYNAFLSGMDIKYYAVDDSGANHTLNAYGRMSNISNTYCETELFSFMGSYSVPYTYYYIALSEDEIIPHMIDAPTFFIFALKNGSSYSLHSDSSQYLLDRIHNGFGTGNMTEFSSISLYFYDNDTRYIYTPIGANDTTIYYSGISPDGNIEDNVYTKQVFKLTYDSNTETFTLTKMSENS